MRRDNFYFSEYTNFINIKRNKKKVIFNSLTGNVVWLNRNFKKGKPKERDFLPKKKFILKNEKKEKLWIKRLTKITNDMHNKQLKIHLFFNKYYSEKDYQQFFVELEEIIQKNHNKSITLYVYIYDKNGILFSAKLNNFFDKNGLNDSVCVIFIINPLIIKNEDILVFNNIRNKAIIFLIDALFLEDKINFKFYLEILYQQIKKYLKNGLKCSVIFNIKKNNLDLLDAYFSFFMKKEDMRQQVKFALNPVKNTYCVDKDFGLFCDPDYNLYCELLNIFSNSPKYNLLKIVGLGLIPKIQQFLLDKRCIRPTIDFCELKSQKVYIASENTWTNCFKMKSGIFDGKIDLKKKCKECSFLFFCSEGCKAKEEEICPPIQEIFEILWFKLEKNR
jgi:radical SAM protein with 4Fe4S-binding SPASM domain